MHTTDPVLAGSKPRIERVPFGTAPDGTPVDLFRLTNCHGLVAAITNYGGIVVSLLVPDRQGKLGDVVLGYDTLAGYLAKSPYFGCLVGRYGNRIAKGEFQLDGRTYSLAKNDGENHLHGGRMGFDKVVWSAKPLSGLVGSPPALRDGQPTPPAPRAARAPSPAAYHRGRVWEPSQGSHVRPVACARWVHPLGWTDWPAADPWAQASASDQVVVAGADPEPATTPCAPPCRCPPPRRPGARRRTYRLAC
jgi:hypothetical protein